MTPSPDGRLDPVCGMWLDAHQTAITYTYLGVTYAFCARECYETFVRAPEQMIALLAHEPRGHCGYPCPRHRQISGTKLHQQKYDETIPPDSPAVTQAS